MPTSTMRVDARPKPVEPHSEALVASGPFAFKRPIACLAASIGARTPGDGMTEQAPRRPVVEALSDATAALFVNSGVHHLFVCLIEGVDPSQ